MGNATTDLMRALAAGCRGVNARLDAWFDEAHTAALATARGSGE